MPINTLTGRAALTQHQENLAARTKNETDVALAASRTLQTDAGKLAMNARVRGHTKVFFYTLANLATGTLLGQLGGYLSRQSSVMQSTKKHNIWKDIAQTHHNATQDLGVLSKANKFLIHVVGYIPGHVLGIGAALAYKVAVPDPKLRAAMKRNDKDGHINFNRIKKQVGVGDLGNMTNVAKPMWTGMRDELDSVAKKAQAEMAKADQNGQAQDVVKSSQHAAVRAAVISGSNNLKGAFMAQARKELATEGILYHQWSQPMMDKLDPASSRHKPNYALSKYELAVAHSDFVKKNSDNQINVGSGERNNLVTAIEAAVTTDYIDQVQHLRDEVVRTQKEVDESQPHTPDRKAKMQRYQQARKALRDLQTADDDRLSPQDSQALLAPLKAVHSSNAGVLNDIMTRFEKRVRDNALTLSGYDADAVNDESVRISDQKRDAIHQLVQLGVNRDEAQAMVNEAYRPWTEASESKQLKPHFAEPTIKQIGLAVDRIIATRKAYVNGLNQRRDAFKQRLIAAGLFEAEAERQTAPVFEQEYAATPGAMAEVDARLKLIDERFNEQFDTATSHLRNPPPADLVYTGVEQPIEVSDDARTYLKTKANTDIVNALYNPDHYEWTQTNGTPNQDVYGAFARDCSRTKIAVNGTTISDPSDTTRTADEQVNECKQKLIEAQVPEDEISILTTALHQGIIGDLQSMAKDPNAQDIMPTPLQFAHSGTKEYNRPGDGISIEIFREDNGTYSFTYTLDAPLGSVSDGRDHMAKSFSTDPRVSRNTMTIRGTLNPKQREAPVEITAAEISYSARPQATAYK